MQTSLQPSNFYGLTFTSSSSPTSPTHLCLPPPHEKCQYKTGKCISPRALKRSGERHTLCAEHRDKQNEIQRRSDRKYQAVHAERRKLKATYFGDSNEVWAENCFSDETSSYTARKASSGEKTADTCIKMEPLISPLLAKSSSGSGGDLPSALQTPPCPSSSARMLTKSSTTTSSSPKRQKLIMSTSTPPLSLHQFLLPLSTGVKLEKLENLLSPPLSDIISPTGLADFWDQHLVLSSPRHTWTFNTEGINDRFDERETELLMNDDDPVVDVHVPLSLTHQHLLPCPSLSNAFIESSLEGLYEIPYGSSQDSDPLASLLEPATQTPSHNTLGTFEDLEAFVC